MIRANIFKEQNPNFSKKDTQNLEERESSKERKKERNTYREIDIERDRDIYIYILSIREILCILFIQIMFTPFIYKYIRIQN